MKKDGITLPLSMLEIAETVGFDAAIVIMDNFGGLDSVYIPRMAREDHKMAQLIGFENYKKICKEFGGQRIFIPRGAFRRLKKSLILEADGKISKRKLCKILGVSQRYVRKIKNEIADDKQGCLF